MATARILLVDNHDSYSYNLVHLIAGVTGAEPDVVLVDAFGPAAARAYDAVVISPGPGHPATEPAFAGCLELLREGSVPVLGVCLGHQGLALAYGGQVERRPPAHGVVSAVHHRGDGLYAMLPDPFSAVRYHSLCVTEVPDELVLDAWTEDGAVMGLRHRELPLFGVQFHPESILTQDGASLVRSFLTLSGLAAPGATAARPVRQLRADPQSRSSATAPREDLPAPAPDPVAETPVVVSWPDWFEPATSAEALLRGERRAFWLDSSRASSRSGRWSYLGWLRDDDQSVALRAGAGQEPIFDRLAAMVRTTRSAHPSAVPFTGGWVGYLGYASGDEPVRPAADGVPDACLLRADRLLAFDHEEHRVLLIAADQASVEEFAGEVSRRLAGSPSAVHPLAGSPSAVHPLAGPAGSPAAAFPPPACEADENWEDYLERFGAVREALFAGNTYETTLTHTLRITAKVDPLALYLRLRRLNPAPYSALLHHDGVWVLSTSPERFLGATADGHLETRPIKGTTPRGSDPQDDALHRWRLGHDAKFLAENLMVADLLRNDLSRVCRPGTVQVTELMAVESYASVHQLVTTVVGWRRPEVDTLTCLRALFPGGSMTGAPKQRTMEIIDRVEAHPRGVYSGALGWFGDDGACDLGIVIRTLVGLGGEWSLGVGGGIVVASDPVEEWAETHWKARLLLAALAEATTPGALQGESETDLG